MKNNQELFKEALADARTLQKVALVNAKKSLAEAFSPKIESMFKSKLAEMEKAEMEEGTDVDDATNIGDNLTDRSSKSKSTNEISSMEEELEGILQELGMDDQESVYETSDEENMISNVDEVDDEKPKKPKSKPITPSDDDLDSDDMGGEDDLGMGDENEEVAELTVSDFKDIVRDAVQSAMSGGAESGMDDMDNGDDMKGDMGSDMSQDSGEDNQELDLDELIAELDGDVNESEDLEEGEDLGESEELEEGEDLDETQELDESEDLEEGEDLDESAKKDFFEKGRAKGGKVGKPFAQGKAGFVKAPTGKTPKISENTSSASKAYYKAPTKGKVGKPFAQGKTGFVKAPTGKTPKISETTDKQLQEAINTIKVLKTTLKETNLLNAKLLFVNKLFKGKQLNESQKVKIITAFDKARNREEVQTIYTSLNETLNNVKKKSLVKESLGFASKSMSGVKPTKELIVENATVKRFQELAGIKKIN